VTGLVDRALSLCHATVPELTPAEAVLVAARTGCAFVSVRLMVDPPGGTTCTIMRDEGLLRATCDSLRATGVRVLDVEVARLAGDTDVAGFEAFLRIAAELGASRVLTTGDDAEPARLVETYGRFCDLAAGFGLGADLEFVPWLGVGGLAEAVRVVSQAARPNAGILVDALHLDRSGGSVTDLRSLRPEWLHYAQICDAGATPPASVAEMIHTAREERLFPGEGELDLVAFLRAMPADIPIAIEVPNATLARRMAAFERVSLAVAATRRVLATALDG